MQATGLAQDFQTLTARLNAATALWLDLALEYCRAGSVFGDDPCCRLARFAGVTTRQAQEYIRVAEALEELPELHAAFVRGELSYHKVRALTRVATPACEENLIDLARSLTAAQLERALRVYRRLHAEQVAQSHELEYVDYYWDDDGSLVLRARLAGEDGTLVIRALESVRNKICARRRAERKACGTSWARVAASRTERSVDVETLVELAEQALDHPGGTGEQQPARLVVHVDAEALAADGRGRSELEHGPVIAPETARRLGCDAELVTSIEARGIPRSVGRKRRTVPHRLRLLVEARDQAHCRWPGCDRRHHLAAHHRHHWAHGGETSLDNLILLCWRHHRLVHEGGYTIEDDEITGEPRFRNRSGALEPSIPP